MEIWVFATSILIIGKLIDNGVSNTCFVKFERSAKKLFDEMISPQTTGVKNHEKIIRMIHIHIWLDLNFFMNCETINLNSMSI